MDFFLRKKESDRSYFGIFADSEVIKDLLDDIVKTSGMNVALADKQGRILLSSIIYGDSSSETKEEIFGLIREIPPGLSAENSPITVQIQAHQHPSFIISPIYSRKWNELHGYLIGGPFSGDLNLKIDCSFD